MSCDDSDKNIKKKHPSFLHLIGPLLGDFVTKYQPLETPKLKNPASGGGAFKRDRPPGGVILKLPESLHNFQLIHSGREVLQVYHICHLFFSCMFNVIHSQLFGKTPPQFGHHAYVINQPNCHKKMYFSSQDQ